MSACFLSRLNRSFQLINYKWWATARRGGEMSRKGWEHLNTLGGSKQSLHGSGSKKRKGLYRPVLEDFRFVFWRPNCHRFWTAAQRVNFSGRRPPSLPKIDFPESATSHATHLTLYPSGSAQYSLVHRFPARIIRVAAIQSLIHSSQWYLRLHFLIPIHPNWNLTEHLGLKRRYQLKIVILIRNYHKIVLRLFFSFFTLKVKGFVFNLKRVPYYDSSVSVRSKLDLAASICSSQSSRPNECGAAVHDWSSCRHVTTKSR